MKAMHTPMITPRLGPFVRTELRLGEVDKYAAHSPEFDEPAPGHGDL